MRTMIIALLIGLVAAAFASGSTRAEKVKCSSIRDAAMCLEQSGCHYDVNKRHCVEGPAPKQDPCRAHEGKSLCMTDMSLGCTWSATDNKCVTKSN
jgi:hypothetical protein